MKDDLEATKQLLELEVISLFVCLFVCLFEADHLIGEVESSAGEGQQEAAAGD